MKLSSALVIAGLLIAFSPRNGLACNRQKGISKQISHYVKEAECEQTDGGTDFSCECATGKPVDITIYVNNQLVRPIFNLSIPVRYNKTKGTLLNFMETAADSSNELRFKAIYFGSPLGYYIDVINNVAASATQQTSWQILKYPNGPALNQGVSSYSPVHGESILFNFTTWGNH